MRDYIERQRQNIHGRSKITKPGDNIKALSYSLFMEDIKLRSCEDPTLSPEELVNEASEIYKDIIRMVESKPNKESTALLADQIQGVLDAAQDFLKSKGITLPPFE